MHTTTRPDDIPHSLCLYADAYYSRKQRWHLLANAEGDYIYAAESLVDLVRWAFDNNVREIHLMDSAQRKLLTFTLTATHNQAEGV
jgi:hypothetical protein